ncbi:uncharacterized protein CANTADRAFT_19244 [Suhomyces tanzawaensis NRRL Y-17324]|uniref:Restriction of telomere capping protein 4 n=1 Tax=Suhomyces tanzawaensis NRRL Y-17324 TaxID=984487 RepID=A0A1E4SQ35_9ASCO|nr:uncharacterized protein CANTADRAFT_19244 [Suhomyces tanzawaensis NRRL Y-17324]ODV81621.1 hypothetical protein CANTADRAFT_19244 [Suhomyces tanzawaensis NRRL Y-17324]
MPKRLSKEYSSIKPTNWKGLPSASGEPGIFDDTPKSKPKKKGIYIHGEPTSNPDVFGRLLKYGYSDTPQLDNDNDDEFESGLIKIDELELPQSLKLPPLTEPEPQVELPSSSSDDQDEPGELTVQLIEGVVQRLNKYKSSQIDVIKQKFEQHKFPAPIVSKKALLKRAGAHTGMISKMLKGKCEDSHYYNLAKKQHQVSDQDTMSSTEKWNINWEIFYGGYYGIKRQLIIGNMINKQFQRNLRSAAKKNQTVSYWTTSAFSTYVLANEIIIRLVMEDTGCGIDEAIELMHQSIEYGLIVADSIDVDDDVELEGRESEVDHKKEDTKDIEGDNSDNEGPVTKKPKMTLIDELVNDVS